MTSGPYCSWDRNKWLPLSQRAETPKSRDCLQDTGQYPWLFFFFFFTYFTEILLQVIDALDAIVTAII